MARLESKPWVHGRLPALAGSTSCVAADRGGSLQVTHASRYPAPVLSLGLSANCATLAVGMANGLLSIRTREGARKVAGTEGGGGGRDLLGLHKTARKRPRQLQVSNGGPRGSRSQAGVDDSSPLSIGASRWYSSGSCVSVRFL